MRRPTISDLAKHPASASRRSIAYSTDGIVSGRKRPGASMRQPNRSAIMRWACYGSAFSRTCRNTGWASCCKTVAAFLSGLRQRDYGDGADSRHRTHPCAGRFCRCIHTDGDRREAESHGCADPGRCACRARLSSGNHCNRGTEGKGDPRLFAPIRLRDGRARNLYRRRQSQGRTHSRLDHRQVGGSPRQGRLLCRQPSLSRP